MTTYDLYFTYLTALFGRFRDDDRGQSAEWVVITGVAIVAAVVVAGIIWAKVKSGADNVTVPSPQAP